MDSRRLLTGLAAIGLLAGLPSAAEAQLYTWRDLNGTLVISLEKPADDRPLRTYAVAGAESSAFRTTRPVLGPRSTLYDELIVEHSTRHGLSPDLVRAVIQAESAFNPVARSHKGAMGLMQLMPATAREYGVANPYDPAENVAAGVAYLRNLLDRYDGNEELALAAYNAGPTAVERYGNAVPPYRETRDYVAKIRGTTGNTPPKPPAKIYKVTEVVNGREVVRYTNVPPKTSPDR